jgi:hypothetical protein
VCPTRTNTSKILAAMLVYVTAGVRSRSRLAGNSSMTIHAHIVILHSSQQCSVNRILTATAMALPIMPSWLIGVLNTKHEATMMITRFRVLATLWVTGDRRSSAYKQTREAYVRLMHLFHPDRRQNTVAATNTTNVR